MVDKHKGKTIFILGSSPQLLELEPYLKQLENEITIVCNFSFLYHKPTYFISGHTLPILMADIMCSEPTKKFLVSVHGKKLRRRQGFIPIFRKNFNGVLPKTGKYLVGGVNVTFAALHLAYILGAKKVVFVGVDMIDKTHFYNYNNTCEALLYKGLRMLRRKYAQKANTIAAINKFTESIPVQAAKFKQWEKHLILPMYQQYVDILQKEGVEVINTSKKGILSQTNATFLSLSQVFRVNAETTGQSRPVVSLKKNKKLKSTFREDWPFLSDPECPDEIKILVSDKITAYYNYVRAHKKLFDCESLDDCTNTSRELIENYLENRAIIREFEYYKEHKNVLGIHNVFQRRKRYAELARTPVKDLTILAIKTLPGRIWRIESEIKKADKPHLFFERTQRLKEAYAELEEVNRLIKIKG